MDESIEILRQTVKEPKISEKEKLKSLQRHRRFVPATEILKANCHKYVYYVRKTKFCLPEDGGSFRNNCANNCIHLYPQFVE